MNPAEASSAQDPDPSDSFDSLALRRCGCGNPQKNVVLRSADGKVFRAHDPDLKDVSGFFRERLGGHCPPYDPIDTEEGDTLVQCFLDLMTGDLVKDDQGEFFESFFEPFEMETMLREYDCPELVLPYRGSLRTCIKGGLFPSDMLLKMLPFYMTAVGTPYGPVADPPTVAAIILGLYAVQEDFRLQHGLPYRPWASGTGIVGMVELGQYVCLVLSYLHGLNPQMVPLGGPGTFSVFSFEGGPNWAMLNRACWNVSKLSKKQYRAIASAFFYFTSRVSVQYQSTETHGIMLDEALIAIRHVNRAVKKAVGEPQLANLLLSGLLASRTASA